jgi:hypothetical protein
MAKKRVVIPPKIRDAVLSEFNYRCAICGTDKPHLHHIDEDPSNNDPMNLLPLCPNCHLIDQHNPTARLDPAKLSLFRTYKDPTILTPEFEPLFRRLRFLDRIEDTSEIKKLESQVGELCGFVHALEMGVFYGKQIEKLTEPPKRAYTVRLGGLDPEHAAAVKRDQQEYREQLRQARNQVYDLVVELLRYQRWESPGKKM